MLGRDVGIAQRFRFLVGAIQTREPPANRRISAARLLGKRSISRSVSAWSCVTFEPAFCSSGMTISFVLLQQREEEMAS